MGKVSFGCEFLFFSLAFSQIQLQSLPFYLHKMQVLGPEGVNVGDDPWVSKMKEGVIDGDATGGGGVEDCELCIFDSSSKEVGD